MRLLLTILFFITLQAQGQALFFAHNQTAAAPTSGLVCTPVNAGYTAPPITSSLYADWAAVAGVTLTDCRVTAWADQSGNGRTLTTSTDTANHPELFLTEGRYALYFDRKTSNAAADYLTATFTLNQPFTIVLVASTAKWSNNPFGMLWSNEGQTFYYGYNDSGIEAHAGGNYGVWAGGSGKIMHAAVYNGASTAFYENTTVKYSGSLGASGFTTFYLGRWFNGAYPVTGYVYRLVIYSRALSAAELSTLYTSFQTQYGL